MHARIYLSARAFTRAHTRRPANGIYSRTDDETVSVGTNDEAVAVC